MTISVEQVAVYFRNRSVPNTDYSLTYHKLQKLVYFAQAWHLALKGTPLFDDTLYARYDGPFSERIQTLYRHYVWGDIHPLAEEDPPLSDSAHDVLDAVWAVYGAFHNKVLEAMCEQEWPWNEARKSSTMVISHESMKKTYGGVSA